ncbi:MAG: hypothetical protein CME71_04620 [Halobacteriovorax sp.]|nr:hypothetical protein [Halobacteriovorax sp.]
MNKLVLLLILFGCATPDDRPMPENGEALLSEFDVAQEEKDRFSFAEIQPTPAPSLEPRTEVKTPVKKPTPKVVKPKPVKEKPLVGRTWPEDYPEIYKGFEAPAQKTWNKFKPLIRVGESISFDISYLGIKAGTINFKVLENGMRGDDLVHHFKATLSSADYYKYIYKLDDYVESFVMAETFLPLKYTLIQRESGQSVDELQLFDHDKLQNKQWFKKIKDGKTRKDDKTGFTPPLFLDPLSLLAFFRGLPLENGDEYFVPIIVRSKVLKVTATVLGREKVQAMGKERQAVKMSVYVDPTEDGKKPTTMNLWYNDAPSRELLRFNAELKFGSVEGEWVQ